MMYVKQSLAEVDFVMKLFSTFLFVLWNFLSKLLMFLYKDETKKFTEQGNLRDMGGFCLLVFSLVTYVCNTLEFDACIDVLK